MLGRTLHERQHASRNISAASNAAANLHRPSRRIRKGTRRTREPTSMVDIGCATMVLQLLALRQNLANHVPVDVGQPPLDAVVIERQSRVIETQ